MFPININTNYRYKNVIKNKKAIGAPTGPQKKEKTKNTFEMKCLDCGETFTAVRSTRLFCSGKCKTAYYKKGKHGRIK
jgi:protein-arginine kinase activator protein McsA